MFYIHTDTEAGYSTPVEGIRMKTLVHGEKTLMTRFHLARGSELPVHSHIHEQSGFLVSGEMILFIGSKEYRVRPGDAWTVPGDVEHRAVVIEDSVAVEVFSPVRQEYLPQS